MESNAKINVVLPEGYDPANPIILHVLEGDAPDPVNKKGRPTITGDISSVSNFLKNSATKKNANPETTIIVCDHNQGAIDLCTDASDPFCWTVSGKLKSNADLVALKINTAGHEYSLPDLRRALKFAGPMFSVRQVHTDIMKKLESVRIRFEQEIQDDVDGKGNENKQNKITTQIDQGLTEGFDLLCPVFEGQPQVKFKVEIVFSAEGRKLTCWFESVELKELLRSEMSRIMKEERSTFDGYTVIDRF